MEGSLANWEDKIAVVILNYNSSSLTIKNVRQIKRLSDKLHIIIVDNKSTDDSATILNSELCGLKNIKMISNDRNRGYAAGNNVGIDYAIENLDRIKAVVICNPDIIIPELDVLKKMYFAITDDEKLGAVTVQTIYNGKINEPNECAWKYFSLARLLMNSSILLGRRIKHNRYRRFELNTKGVSYVDVVQGCFFMCSTKALKDVQGFDESTFLYGEEQILAKRLNGFGYVNGVIPTEFIYHNHQEKDKSLISYEKKIFDIKCFFESRKYYVRYYMNLTAFMKKLACTILEFDFQVKKVLLRFRK